MFLHFQHQGTPQGIPQGIRLGIPQHLRRIPRPQESLRWSHWESPHGNFQPSVDVFFFLPLPVKETPEAWIGQLVMTCGLLNLAAFWSRFLTGWDQIFKGYIFNSTISFLYREKDVIHILNQEKENGKSGHQMEKLWLKQSPCKKKKKLTMVKFSY